ncbi:MULTISPECIES: hypothetical protein [unclassified Microbacterium]|uniref:hypothetical protein n=1 Tax=unclassified Microbacterium TaxID=2609290 RepID=UPI003423A0B7
MNRAEHFARVIARVRERPNLVAHDEIAPLNADGTIVRASYVVMHDLGADDVGDKRYTAPRRPEEGQTLRVVARCVGVDANACRKVADAVIGQLSGWTPSVPGRSCEPLKVDEVGDVTPDKTVSPPLPYIDVDFTYRSNQGA